MAVWRTLAHSRTPSYDSCLSDARELWWALSAFTAHARETQLFFSHIFMRKWPSGVCCTAYSTFSFSPARPWSRVYIEAFIRKNIQKSTNTVATVSLLRRAVIPDRSFNLSPRLKNIHRCWTVRWDYWPSIQYHNVRNFMIWYNEIHVNSLVQ